MPSRRVEAHAEYMLGHVFFYLDKQEHLHTKKIKAHAKSKYIPGVKEFYLRATEFFSFISDLRIFFRFFRFISDLRIFFRFFRFISDLRIFFRFFRLFRYLRATDFF